MTTEDGRVSLHFPVGAFTDDAEVTIEPISCGAPPQGYRMADTCFGIIAIVNGETVSELGADMTICIEYSDDGDPALLSLAYYDESVGEWQVVPTEFDTTAGMVCSTVSHLSDWALLVEAAGGLQWWHYLLIGLGVVFILGLLVMLFTRRTVI